VRLAAADVLDVAGLSVGDDTNNLAVLVDALDLLLGVLPLPATATLTLVNAFFLECVQFLYMRRLN
jgi:hypothetical protein